MDRKNSQNGVRMSQRCSAVSFGILGCADDRCPLCADGISEDLILEIISAAAELSKPVSANQFLDMIEDGGEGPSQPS